MHRFFSDIPLLRNLGQHPLVVFAERCGVHEPFPQAAPVVQNTHRFHLPRPVCYLPQHEKVEHVH